MLGKEDSYERTDSVNRSARPREDVFFAVMGLTGSGKSTFVRNCSKIDVKVGHDLVSCKYNPPPQIL